MPTTTPYPYKASHRFARISVRKLRPILDLIRGKYADDAVNILRYLPHRGARMIEQVLKSSMANAEDKGIRNVGDLIVADARGDGGPMIKRLMPRARGMAYMIRRRSPHHDRSGRSGDGPGRPGPGPRVD
jgi:large subunit ribosomal protein L22